MHIFFQSDPYIGQRRVHRAQMVTDRASNLQGGQACQGDKGDGGGFGKSGTSEEWKQVLKIPL